MHAVLETSKGTIAFRLHKRVAPNTCENFAKLARQGFYDNTLWHRVIDNFVIQGGCPKGDGTGGPGYTIEAEISDRAHVRGTVAMARGRRINSGGSQFYICRSTLPHLDGYDTVFGTVTAGLEVVDAVAQGDKLLRVAIIDE
jgi:peptidyl-prolyl cis-trans isomerase B (cyclophilin B)